MKVILSKDAENLGKLGDVVNVKEGYARNYLFPRKIAVEATPGSLKAIERTKAKRQAAENAEKDKATEFAKKFSGLSVTVNVEVNDLDKLYGAVSEAEIAKALAEEGYDIDRKAIEIEKPIEELGIFEVGVRVHPEVLAKIRVWVTKK